MEIVVKENKKDFLTHLIDLMEDGDFKDFCFKYFKNGDDIKTTMMIIY